MGVFQVDLTIKTAIEMGIEDVKKNPWLIDDILSDTVNNPYLVDKYGQAQIDSCKEWFRNAKINIYMRNRKDKEEFPCITINLGSSQEKEEMKTVDEASTESVLLMPNKIGKPIPYVVKPFTPTSYDEDTGEVGIDPETPGLDRIAPEMILVNPSSGQGYIIKEVTPEGVTIEAGIDLDASQLAIVPKYQIYKARIGHTFFQETYSIGCHVHGDAQALLWLHSIVLYSLLRYREGMFEAQGFAESVIGSGDMEPYGPYGPTSGEEVWSRYITLTGQVENSWIKAPRRFIEKIRLREKSGDALLGGIKILSNLDSPDFVDKTDENWYTVEDDES